METLAEIARRCDEAVENARAELVRAVRAAAASGLTQSQIAAQIGRSQPEVSRLLHFHGNSPRALSLRRHRAEVVRLVGEAGGSNVRVFGSVATGDDHENSDIDLLIDLPATTGLLKLAKLERMIAAVVGTSVDVVAMDDLRPDFQERVLAEAVPL